MQSLVGKLNFASSVVRAGRVYMARLIETLKNKNSRNKFLKLELSDQVQSDIQWWQEHIKLNTGVSMMSRKKWTKIEASWASDSSESGLGAWSESLKQFFHLQLNEEWSQKDINVKEGAALMLSVKKWIQHFRAQRLLVQCDNQAVVTVLNSGRAHNKWLQACLREIQHWCGLNSTEIRAVWIKTEENAIADCLSRWHLNKKYRDKFEQATRNSFLIQCQVSVKDLEFNYTVL